MIEHGYLIITLIVTPIRIIKIVKLSITFARQGNVLSELLTFKIVKTTLFARKVLTVIYYVAYFVKCSTMSIVAKKYFLTECVIAPHGRQHQPTIVASPSDSTVLPSG